jgi:hypothetical protein
MLAYRGGFFPEATFNSPNSGATPAFMWDNGVPSFNLTPELVPSVANGNPAGYLTKDSARPLTLQSINVNVQHQLPGSILLQVAYIGNVTHRITTDFLESINQLNYTKYGSLGSLLTADVQSAAAVAAGIPVPYPGFTGTVAQALRPFPQYAGINNMNAMIGNLNYQAFQVQVQKHFSNGLSFLIGYTNSKNLGDAQTLTGYPSYVAQNAYNINAEKSPTNIDYPQVVVASWTYELPFGPGRKFVNGRGALGKYLLGGWMISGIDIFTPKGLGLNLTTNLSLPTTNDTTLGFVSGLRPNIVPGVNPLAGTASCGSFNPSTNLALNPAAFADPAPFSFGNAPLRTGQLRSCGYTTENLALSKRIPLKERLNLEIGGEFFNLFNLHYWGAPNTDIDSTPGFGTISGVQGGGRTVQVHMKLIW